VSRLPADRAVQTYAGETLQRWVPVLAVLAFSVFAWSPLLTPAYFFDAHDAPHSVFFLVEFDQTIRDGYLWPRWSPDFAFGYGYPLFNVYAPLAFYAAEVLHWVGFTFVGAVKVMYALATVGGGLAMYGFLVRMLGRPAGVLGAVVYMLAPFHLLEVYVRSAYPEFVALALFPLVLWTFTELVVRPDARRVGLAGVSYGLLALTHHASLFTFTPLLVGYGVFLIAWHSRTTADSGVRRLRAPLLALAAGLLGLALAAVYLVPMVLEMRYVKVEQWTAFSYDYRQHFVFFAQLLSPIWGYGYSGPGLADGMSFQLGAAGLVMVILGGWLAIANLLRGRAHTYGGDSAGLPAVWVLFFLAVLAAAVWLMSPAAEFVWQALPIASLVQFPWRLLGIATLALAVVAAGAVGASSRQLWPAGGLSDRLTSLSPQEAQLTAPPRKGLHVPLPVEIGVLCLIVVLGSFVYTLPQYTAVEPWRESPLAVVRWDQFSPADRVGMVIYTEQQPTSGPLEEHYVAGTPLPAAAIVAGEGTVETLRRGGASSEVRVHAVGPITVQFYTYDYPGWQVTVDGVVVPHRPAPPYGLISVDVPAGEHHLTLRMGSTPPRLVGGVVSLAAAVVAVLLTGRGRVSIWRRSLRLL
jgi:hypothetical protein